jgi:large conductance mechanosensitive channel
MFKEFKAFIMKGNVLDLAIAVIIGAAFGAIVTSLVNDVLMPPIGKMMSGINFGDLFLSLDGKTYPSLTEAQKLGAPVIAYGKFLNAVLNFLIVAFVIFIIVKQANRFKKPVEEPVAPAMKDCPMCTSSIPAAAKRCPMCTSELVAGAAR